MCGITGAVWFDGDRQVDPNQLDRMTDVLSHRGPDGRGTLLKNYGNGAGIALGHRRLSIIDLAGGHQPMANENESLWITFNGEIYNYRELRSELVAKGHRFQTNSDTETIIHLYEEMGYSCLERLRGMFAFALWDETKRELFMARDRLGQKPLVYCEEGGRLLFASEVKSILQAPDVPRTIDLEALDNYLAYFYVPQPRSMFAGINKLPPAHRAVYREGKLSVAQYWRPDFSKVNGGSITDIEEELRHEIDQAVCLRLRSDVPLGAFLSGGVDSTAIVGTMQRKLKCPAKTFTIGFESMEFDESAYARETAKALDTDHHEFRVEPDCVEILPKLCRYFDEPFGDCSAIPTYYVSEMTRRHVTVALTGDGGDELFAGYPRYRTVNNLRLFDHMPLWLRRASFGCLAELLPAGGRQASLLGRLKHRSKIMTQPPGQRYFSWVMGFDDNARHGLYSDHLGSQLRDARPSYLVESAFMSAGDFEPAKRAMAADLLTYLPDDLLVKVDIASMAHGLECRSPFLDHRVVELAISIPFRYLVAGDGPKPLLTSSFSEFFNSRIKKRPKMGFGIPLDEWCRNELRETIRDTLLDKRAAERDLFTSSAIRQLLDDHDRRVKNSGRGIWALLLLEMWHRTYIDSLEPPSESGTSATVLNSTNA